MKVVIAGDFVPRYRVASQIENRIFSCIEDIKPIIDSVDFSIVNFESPALYHEAKPIVKTGPNLCCNEKAFECIAQTGFDCITLANNHFRDYGDIGVKDTINLCRKYNIDYVGGGLNLSDAERVLYKDFEGEVLAIINVCENEWSIATDERGGSNPLDIIAVCHSIHEAKKKANHIIVIVHGGSELYNLPTPRMKKTYRFFVENGASAVVNHHQHCYSGYEIYKGIPIFYGLGNFCFDKNSMKANDLWETGFIVELDLSNDILFKIHPYVQCNKDRAATVFMKDTTEFFASIKKLNAVIEDDNELHGCFEIMAKKGGRIAQDLLIPYSSKLGKWLQSKKILPSFISNNRLERLLGQVQCESHRDVLLYGLHDYLNNKQ